MGVPGLFRELVKVYQDRQAKLGKTVRKGAPVDYGRGGKHHVYVDLNGIYHDAAQQVFKYGNKFKTNPYQMEPEVAEVAPDPKDPKSNELVYSKAIELIEAHLAVLKPTGHIVLCGDGVAPGIKQSQQHKRRYFIQLGQAFNNAVISVGTEWMKGLATRLNEWVETAATSAKYPGVVWHFSDDLFPGEGEHKLMLVLKSIIARDPTAVEDHHVFVGMDADFISLVMGCRDATYVWIYRDDPWTDDIAFWFNVSELRKLVVENEFKVTGMDPSSEMYKALIDDYIVMLFMVGNDFIPTSRALYLWDDGRQTLVDAHTAVFHGTQTFTTRTAKGEIRIKFPQLTKLITQLAKVEPAKLAVAWNNITSQQREFGDDLMKQFVDPTTHQFVPARSYRGYVDAYWKDKFGSVPVAKVCEAYLKTLQFVASYFSLNIPPSWRFQYEFHHTPLFFHLSTYLKTAVPKVYPPLVHSAVDYPVSSTLQLYAILPIALQSLIPLPPAVLAEMNRSPGLKELFPPPESVKKDTSGIIRDYQSVAMLPFVDLNLVERIFKTIKSSGKLTPDAIRALPTPSLPYARIGPRKMYESYGLAID